MVGALGARWRCGAPSAPLLIALAYRWVPRRLPGRARAAAVLPLVVAGLWTAREASASVWPYGGFAWGACRESQSDSPLAPLFAWLGVSGVGFVMVFLVAVAAGGRSGRAGVPALVRGRCS